VDRTDKALKDLEKRVVDIADAVSRDGPAGITHEQLAMVDREIKRSVTVDERVLRSLRNSHAGADAWRNVQGRAEHMLKYLEQLAQYLIENGHEPTRQDAQPAPGSQAAPASVPGRGSAQAPDPVGELERKMSLMSVDAMSELQKINEALLACEEEIAGVKKAAEAKDPSAKNNLAQIEARLNKLEGRNDAVLTSELHDAKDKAKEIRRANLRKIEELIGVVEDLFKALRS
jgi:hypothetical protein